MAKQAEFMIDLSALKQQVDLLALAERSTTLRRVASSGGGEWAGPCPFCGGQDRFRVQPHRPDGGRWLCRQCTDGKWQDAIAFGQRLWPGLPFPQVCELLAGGQPPTTRDAHPVTAPENPAYRPPAEDWQASALQAVEICQGQLWEPVGEPARAYLHTRALQDETLRYWRLGYSPGVRLGQAGKAGLWVPRGVLIPCLALDQIWYLKVALLPGERLRCEKCRQPALARQPCPQCGALNKYRGVKGNRPAAIFGADDLVGVDLALFVEGEFDAMLAWQELRDVISVCTLGSATNQPDLATWGPYMAPLRLVLAAYDADEAGQRGARALQALSERVRLVSLPSGEPSTAGAKDITDFVLQGGELWPWLKGELVQAGIA
jgi:DNA primase